MNLSVKYLDTVNLSVKYIDTVNLSTIVGVSCTCSACVTSSQVAGTSQGHGYATTGLAIVVPTPGTQQQVRMVHMHTAQQQVSTKGRESHSHTGSSLLCCILTRARALLYAHPSVLLLMPS